MTRNNYNVSANKGIILFFKVRTTFRINIFKRIFEYFFCSSNNLKNGRNGIHLPLLASLEWP